MLCLLHLFYIDVITCAYCYIEYTRNQEKLIKPKKLRKKPTTPKKTQPLPYKRSDWDRVFLGYTPPASLYLSTPRVHGAHRETRT